MNTLLEIKLYDALYKIARGYRSSEKMTQRVVDSYGLSSPAELLEMSYDNIQATAEHAIRGVRIKRPKP